MNASNCTTGIKISKRDYFRLPPEHREMGDCPMVLSTVNGRATFVLAIFV